MLNQLDWESATFFLTQSSKGKFFHFAAVNKTILLCFRFRKYADNFKIFVQELITPSLTQIPVDVYTPMFLCDLVNLILIVFFYGSFHVIST